MVVTEYVIKSKKVSSKYTFVMLSDMHNRSAAYVEAIKITSEIHPDAILVAGDLVDRHKKLSDLAVPFLRACVEIAPTYFSYGNHESKYPIVSFQEFKESGAAVLYNAFVTANPGNQNDAEFVIGGQHPNADFAWLEEFEKSDTFKILLCHHPEYYPKFLKDRDVDLILSGHAHGGQIRIFNHGIFSPGQGLFPKYTKGLYDNKLIVGAGISNTGGFIPRWGNPTEVLKIVVEPTVL